jgi:signal transduction histidine kinase
MPWKLEQKLAIIEPNRWTFERKLRFGFWVLALIPIVLGIVAFRNAYSAARAAQDVAMTNETVKALEQFLSELKDVEVAQREFILTGDARHLAAVENSRERFDSAIRRLSGMRIQEHWMQHLRSLIPQKLDEVKKTTDLRRSSGIEAASQRILENRGQQAMDDIRRVIANMIAEEERQLAERTGAQGRGFVATMSIFVAVLVLGVVLIWTIAYRVRSEREQIRSLNEQLERRVALRTELLQRSNEHLQQFAYVASHDLKEPLRMISSYSSLLQRRYQGRLDQDADTYIGFITDGVRRMNDLISDLLEYSQAGEVPEESLVAVDTNAVLQNVLSNLKVTIAESRATLTAGKLPPVTCDPVRLTQVFQNLIGNAIKYRGERAPSIEVTASVTGTETIFSVKDNGIGIEPQDLDKIFGIFKRLHGKDYEGTGIGLAMVKKIVERQGGRIWVESKPGDGSTFLFSVPHAHAKAAAESTTA